jgi:hypothetical protein
MTSAKRRVLHRLVVSALLFAATLLALPRTAYAYIDPSAGSVLLQLLLGGVAGVFVVLKLGYRRVLEMLGLHREPTKSEVPDCGSEHDR